MEPVTSLLVLMASIIFIGVIAERIFERTNVPDVLWLILIGVLAGPVFDIIKLEALIAIAPTFSAIALIVILFDGGLHLNVFDVINNGSKGFALSVVNFILSTIFLAAITQILAFLGVLQNWSLLNGLIIGGILGGTSSLIVIPLVAKTTLSKKVSSLLNVESAISDAFTVVTVVVLMEFARVEGNIQQILNVLVGNFAIGIIMGVLFAFMWLYFLKEVAKTRHIKHNYLITFAFLLIVYSAVDFLKGSPAVACLTFGIVLGNSRTIREMFKLKHQFIVEQKLIEFNAAVSFFIKTFFFAFIGMLLSFNLFSIIIGFILAMTTYVARSLAVMVTMKKEKLAEKEEKLMTSLMPRGLAAGVMAIIVKNAEIPGTENITSFVFSTIIFSILLCTIGFYLAHRYPKPSILTEYPNQIEPKEDDSVEAENGEENSEIENFNENYENKP